MSENTVRYRYQIWGKEEKKGDGAAQHPNSCAVTEKLITEIDGQCRSLPFFGLFFFLLLFVTREVGPFVVLQAELRSSRFCGVFVCVCLRIVQFWRSWSNSAHLICPVVHGFQLEAFFLVCKRAPSYIYVKQITSKHCYSLFIEPNVIVLRGLEIEKPETEKVATHQ